MSRLATEMEIRCLEDPIYGARELFAKGHLSLDQFEYVVEQLLREDVWPNDSPFEMPRMERILCG